MGNISIMIIDKQAFFRAGLHQALSQQPDFEIVEGIPSDELIKNLETDLPDVLLLDIDYPSLNGLALGRSLIQRYPSVRLIMLTPEANNEELFETIKIGAVAYLEKNSTVEELAGTIRRVFHGEYPINEALLATPIVAEHVLKQFQEMVSMGIGVEPITTPLTSREKQILRYIADGNSNKQIAQILEISEQTIKNHVSSILRKLNANDRAHAVVLAIRRGVISAEETTEK